jgi:hypothetical protein
MGQAGKACTPGLHGLKKRWGTAALEERGHDPLLLLYTVASRWSDRRMQIDRAVFPGYVFCDLDLHGAPTF